MLTILCGTVAQGLISERLINFGNAGATVSNILANKGLFQLGFTIYLVEMACQITTATLLYWLFRPVSRSLALLMLLFELTGMVIKTFARVFYITPLFMLDGAGSAFAGSSAEQLQSLALVLLKINDYGAATALAFFGVSTVLGGYLVFRSTYLPRWLGVLGVIAGLGWLTFLYPPLGYRVFMFAALFGLLAAAAKIFWLIVFGVNEERFRAVEAANK